MTEAVPLTHTLEDLPADAEVSAPTLVGRGFRNLEQFAVTLRHADGSESRMSRDALRVGSVVGVLPVDLARGEVVLIRQFRLAAHLRLGKGDLVEIVAGYIDPGEEPAAAARRECLEEIGVSPSAVRELFRFMPAPGLLDEQATIFLAAVDAARVPAQAGAAHETEHTRPIRVPIEAAVAALSEGRVHNGYLIVALQWLALNRDRLSELLNVRQ
jgi:ADP-ribose pyrophosphatase